MKSIQNLIMQMPILQKKETLNEAKKHNNNKSGNWAEDLPSYSIMIKKHNLYYIYSSSN